MKTLHTWAVLSAGAILLGCSGPNSAGEPASFARTAKELGFPVTDITITFSRLAQHTYRMQFSTPPNGDYLMLYTELYFCGARKLALDAGFDRVALVPDPESPQGGIAVFLKPGEDATKVLEPRYIIGASFDSIELFSNCPPSPPPTK